MSIKSKIKSVWNKVASKARTHKTSDSELAADEVIEAEVFPEKTAKKRKSACTRKPASKRTRPTNHNYQMIDPDDDTCDSSKS